jgi:predicted ester cyclase
MAYAHVLMFVPPPPLVQAFYDRIWNAGDLEAATEIVVETFVFRGSLGAELSGRNAFLEYVRSVREVFADYRCDVLECVAANDRAFAKMRFGGRHVGAFRGFAPTGKPVHRFGAALFHFESERIVELWVLGDLAGLDDVLGANASG